MMLHYVLGTHRCVCKFLPFQLLHGGFVYLQAVVMCTQVSLCRMRVMGAIPTETSQWTTDGVLGQMTALQMAGLMQGMRRSIQGV